MGKTCSDFIAFDLCESKSNEIVFNKKLPLKILPQNFAFLHIKYFQDCNKKVGVFLHFLLVWNCLFICYFFTFFVIFLIFILLNIFVRLESFFIFGAFYIFWSFRLLGAFLNFWYFFTLSGLLWIFHLSKLFYCFLVERKLFYVKSTKNKLDLTETFDFLNRTEFIFITFP